MILSLQSLLRVNASLNCKDLNERSLLLHRKYMFIYFTVPTTVNYEFLSFWPNKYFQFFYVDLLSGFWGFGVFLIYILK